MGMREEYEEWLETPTFKGRYETWVASWDACKKQVLFIVEQDTLLDRDSTLKKIADAVRDL